MRLRIRFTHECASFRLRAAGRWAGQRAAGGFTLVEVLIALIIVAVGVLGLQALGIVAARGLAIADSRSAYATLAGDSLASALHQLRRGTVPRSFCATGPREGERFERIVDITDPSLAHVRVTIEPAPGSRGLEVFAIESSVFLPGGTAVSGAGGGCG